MDHRSMRHGDVECKRIRRDEDVPIPELLSNKQYYPLIAGPGALKAAAVEPKLLKLTVEQQEAVNRAKKYAMEQSIKSVLEKQTVAYQQQQQKTLQRHQAIVLMCRIYIGSISFELREDAVKLAFLAFGPIKSINMSFDTNTQKHKGFAFVEYEIPEAAHMALEHMNGFMMGNRNIKVGRPSNMPQASMVIEQLKLEALNYFRIYIASIHAELTEKDIKSVFEAFGTIKTCSLPEGSNGKHRGYGFIEYETEQAMQEAIAAMNMFDLAGQNLRVCRAVTPPDVGELPAQSPGAGPTISTPGGTPASLSQLPTAAAIAAAAATAKIQAMDALSSNGSPKSVKSPLSASGSHDHSLNGLGSSPQANIPPPALVTTLPLSLKRQMNGSPAQVSGGENSNSPTALSNQQSMNGNGNGKIVLEDRIESVQEEHQTLQQQEGALIKGSSARQVLMHKLMRRSESRVLVLRNMIGADEVDDELEGEITEECGKYGAVKRVIIYQERQSEEEDAEIVVKIFVEFSTMNEAIAGRDSLNGRFFGGRKVRAELYEQNLYDEHDLSA